jgi:hypothetical protein
MENNEKNEMENRLANEQKQYYESKMKLNILKNKILKLKKRNLKEV